LLPHGTGDSTTATSPILEDQLSVIQIISPADSWELPYPWPYTNFGINYDAGSTGEDRLLIVGVSFVNDRGSEDVISVSYGGVPMNREIGEYIANRGYAVIYSLVDPPMGEHEILVEWNNTIEVGSVIGAVVFEGVDQTSPIALAVANEETGPNPFVTINSRTDQVVVGVGVGSPSSPYTIVNTGESLWNTFAIPGQLSGMAQYQRGGIEDSVQWASNLSPFSVVAVALEPIDVMEEITFTQVILI